MASAATQLQPEAVTRFHQRIYAEELSIRSADPTARAARAISEARVDLNPHQVEAAAFALDSLARGGCLLADEVGLGKTIEAGIVLAQLAREGKNRLLILAPATLRAQWQAEMFDKFQLEAEVIDGRQSHLANCFDNPKVVIASIPFAAARPELLAQIPWDLVVIDEAHRLRNAHRPGNKTGKALTKGLKDRPKLLLTATPLQNELSELFGLLSLLDEQILGPQDAFETHFIAAKGEPIDGEAQSELKRRIAPVVQRTLRRQVREYVRFTNRRSVVEDFAPSADEETLYEDVSEWLRTSEVLAMDPGRKTLLTLVYRKLLASSTFAIGPTLAKVADGLRKKLQGDLATNAWLEKHDADGFREEADEWAQDPSKAPDQLRLHAELKLLDALVARAQKIGSNAKGEALRRALDRVFTVARAHQWPEKAVIFTESKRTQDYLVALLSAHGWAGKICALSGAAGSPEERKALVDEFRDRASLLISTEAGAEGLNLQFCNLVVNYDLPWNPQRIEQRIGRCHRYGQQRDVLVLNLLNRRNAADARLYELLEKKLELFDGVFGASDEILGALGDGIDFEKRVLDIYQSCRKPEEIDAAFDALRSTLEGSIGERMSEAQSLLLERFDTEVRRRLRMAGDAARTEVAKRQVRTGALADGEGSNQVVTASRVKEVRERGVDPVSYLELDPTGLPLDLRGLSGKEGWWFAYRFELSGLRPEERVVHLVLLREGDGFKVMPLEQSAQLLQVSAGEATGRRPTGVISVAAEQEKALEWARDQVHKAVERRTQQELDEAKERADRFAEDCLLGPRADVEAARGDWEEARQQFGAVTEAAERVKARALVERKEREYRKKLGGLRQLEETRYQEKDTAMARMAHKSRLAVGRTLLASAYFWVGRGS